MRTAPRVGGDKRVAFVRQRIEDRRQQPGEGLGVIIELLPRLRLKPWAAFMLPDMIVDAIVPTPVNK